MRYFYILAIINHNIGTWQAIHNDIKHYTSIHACMKLYYFMASTKRRYITIV